MQQILVFQVNAFVCCWTHFPGYWPNKTKTVSGTENVWKFLLRRCCCSHTETENICKTALCWCCDTLSVCSSVSSLFSLLLLKLGLTDDGSTTLDRKRIYANPSSYPKPNSNPNPNPNTNPNPSPNPNPKAQIMFLDWRNDVNFRSSVPILRVPIRSTDIDTDTTDDHWNPWLIFNLERFRCR